MDMKDTEEFYNAIAEKYDWLLSDWDIIMERHMQLLIPLFKKNNVKRVLDCACGTGLQAIGLLEAGYEVVASDLSEKMLEQAINNAKKRGLSLSTVQSDFRELTSKISGEFDAVICMGNSLPHLFTDKDIKKALLNMYQILKKKGIVIIEIRNFERLEATEGRFLPVRVNAEHGDNLVTIFYVIDYHASDSKFNVIYIIQNKKSKEYTFEVHSIDYHTLKKERVLELLEKVGFLNIETISNPEFIVCIAYKK